MINQKNVTILGWSVLLVLIAITMAIGSPRRSTVLAILGMWCVACVAYILAVPSKKPADHLLKNVFLACAFAAAVTYCNPGEPESDEDGFIVEEGFDATEGEKAKAAANTFARFSLSALSGVGVALLVRQRAGYRGANTSASEPPQQPEDGFEDGDDGGDEGAMAVEVEATLASTPKTPNSNAAADANPRRVSRSLLLCRVRVGAAERQAVGRLRMTDDFDDGRSYLDIEIEGRSPDTEIWLGDNAGSLVQKEIGVLRSTLIPGHYVVEFGLGTTCYPIALFENFRLTQREIELGASCERPVFRLGDDGA